MSDRRLAEARYNATNDPNLENLLHLEHCLEAAGEKAEETFYPILQAYESEIKRATQHHGDLVERQTQVAEEEYIKQHGLSLKCALCNDSKWIRHFDTDYPCSCEGEKTFQPDWYALRKIRASVEVPGMVEASESITKLREELAPRKKAASISVGALVQYNNPRAHAKIKDTGEKLELWTLGIVQRVFHTRYGYGGSSTEKAAINTYDGDYETATTNLDPRALNAWARLRGFDAEGQKQKQQKILQEEDAAILLERFGEFGLSRGMRVMLHEHAGIITWLGRDRETGRTRIGFKVGRNPARTDPITWAFAVECMPCDLG
jgi:hypothetical protein